MFLSGSYKNYKLLSGRSFRVLVVMNAEGIPTFFGSRVTTLINIVTGTSCQVVGHPSQNPGRPLFERSRNQFYRVSVSIAAPSEQCQ